MSKSKNSISLIGNVGADPKFKTFSSGKKIAELLVITNDGFKDASGEWKDKPNGHSVKIFGNLVNVVEKYVKIGDRVAVDGSVDYNKFEDKQGVTKYFTAILCRDLILLGGSKGKDNASPATTATASTEQADEDENLPF